MARKKELLQEAEDMGLEVPKRASKKEIQALIDNRLAADQASKEASTAPELPEEEDTDNTADAPEEQEEDLRAGLPVDAGQDYPVDPNDEVDETADDTKEDQQQVNTTNTGEEEFEPNITGYSYGSAPDTDQSPPHLKAAREKEAKDEE